MNLWRYKANVTDFIYFMPRCFIFRQYYTVNIYMDAVPDKMNLGQYQYQNRDAVCP